jgi:hypothetical protein
MMTDMKVPIKNTEFQTGHKKEQYGNYGKIHLLEKWLSILRKTDEFTIGNFIITYNSF